MTPTVWITEPNRNMDHRPPSDRNTCALSMLRIAVGVLFLIFGEYKVFGMQFTLGGS